MKSFVLFFITIVFSMQLSAQADVQKKLQKQLILAEAGAVIEIPEGVFEFTNTLSLEEKKKITLNDLEKGFNMYLSNEDVKNRKDDALLKKQLYSSIYC